MMLGIHMNAVAQEHLFPEVTFTYQGETYTVPAWDAKCAKGERVQSTFEKTTPDEVGDRVAYNGIIVATACGISSSTGRPVGDFSEGDITIGENTYTAAEVTYGDIFPEMNEALGAEYLFSKATITGEYTVPKTAPVFEDDPYANTYNIIGIGDGAYANKSWSHSDNTLYMRATKTTIPIHIKSLGKYSFLANGYMTEAVIPQESEIAIFPEGVFADCMRAKKLRLTNSITSIESHAFGGCKVLRLLYAYNNESPVVAADAFTKYEGSTAEDCVPGKLAIWTYDLVAVRNYRATNALWNEFIFRAPIPQEKYITFYSDMPIWRKYPNNKDADYPDTNPALASQSTDIMKIYYARVNECIGTDGKSITLTNLSANNTSSGKCPYNSGLILYTNNTNVYFAPTTVENKARWLSVNYLHGSVEPINMDDVIANNSDKNVYVLKNGQFRCCSGGTLPAGKAYLMIPTEDFPGRTSTAKELKIVFEDEDGEADGIKSIYNSQMRIENGVVYDLQGRVVSTNGMDALPKGIYIMNGKKYTK